MIGIKNKKFMLFGACLTLIAIVALPSVLAYPPMVVETPDWLNTYKGSHIYGDLDDLQSADGDAVHWQGLWYILLSIPGKPWWWFWDWPHFCEWRIGASVAFDRVYGIETDNYINTKYKLDGPGTLRIVVWYFQGGSDTFYKYDTGGVYTTEIIYFDNYKSVSHIDFDYLDSYIWYPSDPPPNVKPYFYLDYAAVYYGFN